jgi:hypothetical protein
MVWNPLQRSVTHDDVDVCHTPVARIGDRERHTRHRSGFCDHLRRRVEALDDGMRPPRGQRRREMAPPAADIDDVAGRAGPDPCGQVEERPVTLGREAPVLRGIPSHRLSLTTAETR